MVLVVVRNTVLHQKLLGVKKLLGIRQEDVRVQPSTLSEAVICNEER